MLTVPDPALAYEPLAPGVAALELPLTVVFAPVDRDGATLGLPDLATFGLVVRRRTGGGSLPEVWAPQTKQWLPDTGPDPVRSQPLAFITGQPQPWQGLVVAAGTVDAAGLPVFDQGVGGFPSYSFAGVFVTHDGEVGASGNSLAVTFAPVTDRNLMVIGPGDGEKPEKATKTRVQLRNTDLATIGGLVIDRATPGAEVTLGNSTGAFIVLRPDGSIELHPATDHKVIVVGDLETEKVTYRPSDGSSKKTLT